MFRAAVRAVPPRHPKGRPGPPPTPRQGVPPPARRIPGDRPPSLTGVSLCSVGIFDFLLFFPLFIPFLINAPGAAPQQKKNGSPTTHNHHDYQPRRHQHVFIQKVYRSKKSDTLYLHYVEWQEIWAVALIEATGYAVNSEHW